MAHLESKFSHGMSWDNIGEWHIDHKTPKAAFRFSSHEDDGFKECWSLENLQPLWRLENISKGDKLPSAPRGRARYIYKEPLPAQLAA